MTDNLSNLSNSLSNNEIIKALECCSDFRIYGCKSCPFDAKICMANYKGTVDLSYPIFEKALDLINRQKAEIERLKEEVTEHIKKGVAKCKYDRALIEAEVIKEFAERLKKRMRKYSLDGKDIFKAVEREDIDDLVKEMVGDNE